MAFVRLNKRHVMLYVLLKHKTKLGGQLAHGPAKKVNCWILSRHTSHDRFVKDMCYRAMYNNSNFATTATSAEVSALLTVILVL